MRRRVNNPWVDGAAADPFLALLTGLVIVAVVAGLVLLLH